MRSLRPRSWFRATSTGAALLGVLFVFGCADQANQPTSPEGDLSAAFGEPGPPQELGPALAAQQAHSDRLMGLRDVVGTGVGINDDGEPALAVYLTRPGAAGVPERLDDVPVERIVTGLIVADSDPTTRQRPAPVGYSIGHPDITAGTFGARVTDGSNVFLLSNNHVMANSNDASTGDPIYQPGPYDGGDSSDEIAQLSDFEVIEFDGSVNYMDAAIAVTTTDLADAATPTDDAYGAPNSTIYDLDADGDPGTVSSVSSDLVDLPVTKYGRTTELTQGTIAEVNVTVTVCYEPAFPFGCNASAYFEDQLSIEPGSFSDGGDSGSLIVTDDGSYNPVSLLFAGSDTRTIGNRIDRVLNRFAVDVDGGGDSGDTNSAPTASFTHSCTDLSCEFDGSGSSDSDGSISSYSWDVDGDGTEDYTGSMASHTYDAADTYTVTLTVTDDDGATDTSSQDVTVSEGNSAPTASFTHSCTDLSCDFDGSGSSDSDGSISSYDWDFGDGNTATGETTSHTYGAGGTYTVTLTVTDDDGATDSSSQDVTVEEASTGDFSLSVTAQKVRGVRTVDLTWEGASSINVDIFRDGSLIATTDNTGSYTDDLGRGGGGSFTYQVCEAGTSTCSNEATATF